MSKASVYNDLTALKLVIHPSVTGTALEHDGARGVIQCNGEKFCCVVSVSVCMIDNSMFSWASL